MTMMATIGATPRGRLMAMTALIAALLLVPLVAMRFTTEVRWTTLDFVAAGALLGAAAIGSEWAIRRLEGRRRLFAIAAVLAVVLLLWARGAVGID